MTAPGQMVGVDAQVAGGREAARDARRLVEVLLLRLLLLVVQLLHRLQARLDVLARLRLLQPRRLTPRQTQRDREMQPQVASAQPPERAATGQRGDDAARKRDNIARHARRHGPVKGSRAIATQNGTRDNEAVKNVISEILARAQRVKRQE